MSKTIKISIYSICIIFSSSLFSQEAKIDIPESSEIKMLWWQSAILGVVEGVTEYLPVSSTGHLVVTQRLMGFGVDNEREKEASDAFAISIQAGAILAVFAIYFRRIMQMLSGVFGKSPQGLKNLINLFFGFLPAAVIGLSFNKIIKQYLFGIEPIIIAWFVGGIFILLFVKFLQNDGKNKIKFENITWKIALLIGIIQCLAMWPGVSRSLVTLLGGLVLGLSLASALEFSFLLGLITLSAATAKDTLEHGKLMLEVFGGMNLFIGFITALISAFIAVKWMLSYLQKHSLSIFGYYRIAISLVTWIYFFKIL